MRPLFLEHALKINPLRELNSALAKAERPVASIIHIGAVESAENLADFRFDQAEGAGKPCHTVQTEFEILRTSKLVEYDERRHGSDFSEKVGTPLQKIKVYPRE